MNVVEKSVQNMLKHFTWVSFLLSFIHVRMLTIDSIWVSYMLKSPIYIRFLLSGTLLMTPERRKAIWAIYGQ